MKQILGVVGEKLAGKDTFCRLFEEMALHSSLLVEVRMLRYSDLIATCLTTLRLPLTRENMQIFSPLMESAYGKGVLSRAMTEEAILAEADIVIIQGIRWLTDLEELRKFGGTLVYVTASKDNRLARAQKRTEKPDEVGITRKKFEEQENAPTEIYIPVIGAQADFRLENDGTMEEFKALVAKFAAGYLPGWSPK